MSTGLSDQILDALKGVLTEHQVGVELETRRVQRAGELGPSEMVINVLPDNRDSAAAMQVHVENSSAVDLTLGKGTVLEYLAGDTDNTDSFLSRLVEIASAIAAGNFREKVTSRKGMVGSAKGEIHARSGVIKSSTYDSVVGWLFARGETILVCAYAPGNVRLKEGAPITLP
jgi:hypothetical protein